jgi:hypothetical protein
MSLIKLNPSNRMTCCHRSLTKKKKESKKGGKNGRRKKMILSNTPMFANWVQIVMGKTSKTIKVDHNKFYFF